MHAACNYMLWDISETVHGVYIWNAQDFRPHISSKFHIGLVYSTTVTNYVSLSEKNYKIKNRSFYFFLLKFFRPI